MKIEFSQQILDQKGKPIAVEGEAGSYMTLQTLAEQALLSQFMDERDLPTVDKLKRFKLFNKITGGDGNLNAEEVTLLKFCIGKGFAPLAVGRAYDIIEAAEKAGG